MPHKPAPLSPNKVTFVSSSLTVQLKPALAQYAKENCESVLDLIQSALLSDYRFSCKAEEKAGFQASLSATERVKFAPNRGKVLVERGGSPERAILRLFWAHNELFKDGWPDGDNSIDDDW